MPHLFTPPAEPGFRFSGGKLRIFQGDAIMVIHAWPDLAAVRKDADCPLWTRFRPGFRLVTPYRRARVPKKKPAGDAAGGDSQLGFDFLETMAPAPAVRKPLSLPQQRKRAFDQFRFALPKDVARAVEPFCGDQWPLLLLLRYDPSAVDLTLQNPVLAYLMARELDGDRGRIEKRQCGTLRQRELLACLGFPDSNGVAALFRKIDPASVNGDNGNGLLSLLRGSADPIRRRLAHLTRINAGVVAILLDAAASDAVGNRLLQEVADDRRENYRTRVLNLVTNTLSMQETLQTRRPVRKFPDLARLESVHREVSEAYRERMRRHREVRRHSQENFRRPPIPPIPGAIEALTSAEALVDEGEAQGNCVATYAEKVARGETFIYRVLKPKRATLSIVRSPSSGIWRISELEGRFNTPADEATERQVQAWLRRFQVEA